MFFLAEHIRAMNMYRRPAAAPQQLEGDFQDEHELLTLHRFDGAAPSAFVSPMLPVLGPRVDDDNQGNERVVVDDAPDEGIVPDVAADLRMPRVNIDLQVERIRQPVWTLGVELENAAREAQQQLLNLNYPSPPLTPPQESYEYPCHPPMHCRGRFCNLPLPLDPRNFQQGHICNSPFNYGWGWADNSNGILPSTFYNPCVHHLPKPIPVIPPPNNANYGAPNQPGFRQNGHFGGRGHAEPISNGLIRENGRSSRGHLTTTLDISFTARLESRGKRGRQLGKDTSENNRSRRMNNGRVKTGSGGRGGGGSEQRSSENRSRSREPICSGSHHEMQGTSEAIGRANNDERMVAPNPTCVRHSREGVVHGHGHNERETPNEQQAPQQVVEQQASSSNSFGNGLRPTRATCLCPCCLNTCTCRRY